MSKRKALLCFIDMIICFVSFAFPVFLGKSQLVSSVVIPDGTSYLEAAFAFVISLGLIFAVRMVMGIYKTIWRYAGVGTYLKMVVSDFISGVLIFLLGRVFPRFNIGFGVAVTFVALCCLATLSARFAYQFYYARLSVRSDISDDAERDHRIDIAIVGAGNIGASLAQELLRNPRSHYRPICFVDSDISKAGQKLNGLPIYPADSGIVERLSKLPIQQIVIAMPELDGDKKAKLFEIYSAVGCKVKLYDYPLSHSNETHRNDIARAVRDIRIDDLLFRDNIEPASKLSESYYMGKTVLVTGGGGSIGSELCRRIAGLSPRRLAIFDIYENNAYAIEQELRRSYGDSLALDVYIGSVRDAERINSVIAELKPDIVLHAAAHKHVPLMEKSPCEAVKNNIIGTYNTVLAAERNGVERFVLISTDKAVNPTNVMGATKRFCEMIVRSRISSKTTFAAVRFGNVLGSNGSVIPLFKQQIENGGPVTVTDKRIIRYFMTIPEAASLVLEAGAMSNRGELYVLDMGKPIKIYDLAVNMITLAGLELGRDIEIEEIGLRPGEKLYEELLVKGEQITKTENSLIYIEKDTPLPEKTVDKMVSLLDAASRTTNEEVTELLHRFVPTFITPDSVNSSAERTIKEELGVGI